MWRKADGLTAVSMHDRNVMEEYLSFSTYLVANGVDTETFAFQKNRVM